MKNQHSTIALLILIMTTVAVTVGGIAIYLLYREAYSQKKDDLMQSTQAMSSLIETVAQFDRIYSEHTNPQGHIGATISQVAEAFRQRPILVEGEEWLVGRVEGDHIRLLISADKQGLKKTQTIPFNGANGQGIQLALKGQRGVQELIDYRGHPCLIAYAPIPTLGVGIVNKKDLVQIRAPFIRAAWLTAWLGAITIGFGTFLFLRIGQGINRRLQQSEQRLSGIVNTSPVGVFETDATGNCLFVNGRWSEITGISAEEAKGSGWLRTLHPDDLPRVKEDWGKMVESCAPFKSEYRFIQPDKTVTWVYGQTTALIDNAGNPSSFVGTLTDITLQKHYADALESLNENLETRIAERTQDLQEERNFISTLLETIGALVIVLDSDGRIVRFNKACEQVTGFTHEELKGNHIWDVLIPLEQKEKVQQIFSQLSKTHLPSHYENDWLTKSGERRLVAWSNTTLQDQHGAIFVIGCGIDITRHRQAENALIQAKVEAEVANNAKSEFLSRMSHELRTPLNAILGFSQLLESDASNPLTTDQAENVQEILKAGYHLLDLVNEVLDLARIESGNMHCNLEPLYVEDAVENSIHAITPLAQQREISLISEIAACNQTYVMADGTRLRQVLTNLLSNAVKYNKPEGSILLACEELDSTIRISITDTGKGIEPQHLASLFTPFERLGAEFSDVGGTGIGLALSKQLMKLMGGDIGVGNTVGQGSTFWIELPKAPPPINVEATDKPPAEIALDDSKKVNILYVENNPANLKLVKAMLSRYPAFALLPARTAEIGLELAKLHKPDVVLMDINLPGMDGYQGLAWLSANAETHNTPVIALTADAMPHDVERGMNAGFFAYLTKPIDANELLATISLALKKKE